MCTLGITSVIIIIIIVKHRIWFKKYRRYIISMLRKHDQENNSELLAFVAVISSCCIIRVNIPELDCFDGRLGYCSATLFYRSTQFFTVSSTTHLTNKTAAVIWQCTYVHIDCTAGGKKQTKISFIQYRFLSVIV